jgi:hypothetical protein
MYNEECATLVLRSGDLINGSNSVGTSDARFTNMTWSNINLRTLLGNMYDKYDRFALVPISFQTIQGGNFGAGNDDRCISINIAGLPFTNNNYNASTKTNQNSAIIYVTRFIANNSSNSILHGTVLNFTKNQDIADINIFYQRIIPDGNNSFAISNSATPFPHIIFTFNIYGVQKTERVPDLNSSRMFDK